MHLFDKEYELFDVKDITSYEGEEFTHSVTFDKGGCTNLSATGICKVYDKRPYTCDAFNCGVLVKYKKGEYEPKHYHKVATEITIITKGRVVMNFEVYNEGDIIVMEPGEATDFRATNDVTTTVIKFPCVEGDKYLV